MRTRSALSRDVTTHRWMARFWRKILPVLPLIVGFACLLALDASDPTGAPAVAASERAPPTRLLVVMIDSLDRRDVGALPALSGRLAQAGLHGRVRACVDGVTIPCVSAMVTGFDRASGFSPLRNFGAARGLAEESVLGAIERRGHRVGYFGDPLLAKALRGLSVVYAQESEGPSDDDVTLQRALTALDRERLDLLFVHLMAIDETAHKHGAESSEYQQALRATDARVAAVMAQQKAGDHLVVLGDHGHERSGRHSADVGTETFAAYFGPRFARHAECELVMTDHAALWARLFGLRLHGPSVADAYFAGESLPDSEVRRLASRPRAAGPLLLTVALALGLALAAHLPDAVRRSPLRAAIVLALGVGMMIGSAVIVRNAHAALGTVSGSLLAALGAGLSGAAVLGAFTRAGRDPTIPLATLGLTGALLFALPTAEPTAGIKAPVLWLLCLLLVAAARALRQRQLRRACELALCSLLLFALALVRVREHLPRVLVELEVGRVGAIAASILLLLAIVRACGARAALAFAAGELALWLLPDPSARWLIAPAALVLPLCFLAYRLEAAVYATCFLLPIALGLFYPLDTAQLSAIAVSCLLWAWLLPLLRAEHGLMRAAWVVLLMWLSFWAAMSTRVGGIDYDFYFRWLPANEGATGEAIPQGLLTAAKCMLPTVFGAMLAKRAGALPLASIKIAEHFTRVRLALSVVFVAGLSWTHDAVDVQWIYDATQEVAFWILAVAVLGLIAAANQIGEPPANIA